MPTTTTNANQTRKDRSKTTADLERRVVKRFNSSPPASFQDLIEEGLVTEGQANTMRDRLRERLVVVGERPAKTGRGRPHRLYAVKPKRGT